MDDFPSIFVYGRNILIFNTHVFVFNTRRRSQQKSVCLNGDKECIFTLIFLGAEINSFATNDEHCTSTKRFQKQIAGSCPQSVSPEENLSESKFFQSGNSIGSNLLNTALYDLEIRAMAHYLLVFVTNEETVS